MLAKKKHRLSRLRKRLKLTKCTILLVKKQLFWIWKVLGHTSRRLLAWECGDRSKATLEKLDKRVGLHQAKRVHADKYSLYTEVIGAGALRQGKQNTYNIEQNNGRQRHWLARFHRRSVVASKSAEMVELALALFQRFRVNGNIMELVSLLK